jgi:hypothetical protein
MDDATVAALASELTKLCDAPKGYAPKQWSRMEKIQAQLAAEFGRRRGWKRSRSSPSSVYRDLFGAPELMRLIDNPYFYCMPNRRYAIASHVYNYDRDEDRALAAKHNLTVEHITDFPSWWYPGETKLVVWYPAA